MRTAREPLTSQRDLAWGQLADAVCDLNEEMELGNKPKQIWLRGLE